MKRLFMVLVGVAVGLTLATVPAQAATNDFRFTRFEADYYLSKDANNQSTLKTIERLTADFPASSKNHGIERAIPKSYDGHSVGLHVASVTNEKGEALQFSTYSSNGNEVLRIGDKDTYVQGVQTYVLTYTQRDVTKNFGGIDEFYWDTNGTEGTRPFDEVIARVHIDDSLTDALLGQVSCYRGMKDSTQQCDTSSDSSGFSIDQKNLGIGENVTVAIGFKAGTFAQYQPTLGERLVVAWLWVTLVTTGVGCALLVWISVRYVKKNNRSAEMGTIVPEYIPPKDSSLLVSEQIGKGTRAGMTAVIIDLSVRHYLKLYQTQEKSMFKSAEYELEIARSTADLREEEKTFIETLFGKGETQVGSRFALKKLKNDYKIAAQLRKDTKVVTEKIKGEYGLRHTVESESRWFSRLGWMVLGFGVVTLAPMLLIVALVAFICASQLRPLTDTGLLLRRYLEGLKLYIGVAEEERLKMLQSPEGAEKTGVTSTDNTKKMVKLYERVLSYAVLFGQEKQWNEELGRYYERSETQPDWYSGHAAFSAAVFATSMNEFSTTTNSYSASTSSSSSGSSGGGSSGGGGGGGGSGGW